MRRLIKLLKNWKIVLHAPEIVKLTDFKIKKVLVTLAGVLFSNINLNNVLTFVLLFVDMQL